MSLRSDILDDWAKNGASMKEYPIHKGEEKSTWDTIEITKGKKLSLFPFTKKAITNLYMCILQPDYRTPRCNQQLISSISEVVKIHEQGAKRRQDAEMELVKVEQELKQALLEAGSK